MKAIIDLILFPATYFWSFFWPPSWETAPGVTMGFIFAFYFCAWIWLRNPGRWVKNRERMYELRRREMAICVKSAQVEKENETKNKGKKNKEKKKNLDTKYLYRLLFDENEMQHVYKLGIDEASAEYQGVRKIFNDNMRAAINDAVRITKLGKKMITLEESDTAHTDMEDSFKFQDGSKLREILQFYEEKVIPNFGRIIPDSELRAAKIYERTLDTETRKGMLLIWDIARSNAPLWCIGCFLLFCEGIVGPALWAETFTALDSIVAGEMELAGLKMLLMNLFFKFVCLSMLHSMSKVFMGLSSSRFVVKLKCKLMSHILHQDTDFFDSNPTGVLMERIKADSDKLFSNFNTLPWHLLWPTGLILGNGLRLYGYDRKIFYAIVIPLPFMATIQWYSLRWQQKMEDRQSKIGEVTSSFTMEKLREIRTVREFAMEDTEAEVFGAHQSFRGWIGQRTMTLKNMLGNFCFWTYLFSRLWAVWMGGSLLATGLMSHGKVMQIAEAAMQLNWGVQQLFENIPKAVKMLNPAKRLVDILMSKPKIEPELGQSYTGKLRPEQYLGKLELRDVEFTFRHEPNKKILKKLSFTAEPGMKVALVGKAGCGKSTTFKLISRFYDPTKGKILLDDKPLEDYDVRHYRKCLSVVSQDIVLFNTTLRENILYGIPRDLRTKVDVEDACRKAYIWDDICSFQRRLETRIGQSGVQLSGGQKQRVAIARAIIRKPIILLLDEATSALDSKSEKKVQQALDNIIDENKSGCTLMIAHRLSTIRECDKIIVMDDGKKMEEGTHTELLQIPITKSLTGEMRSGWYHDLWATQMGETKERIVNKSIQSIQLSDDLPDRSRGPIMQSANSIPANFGSKRVKKKKYSHNLQQQILDLKAQNRILKWKLETYQTRERVKTRHTWSKSQDGYFSLPPVSTAGSISQSNSRR